MRGGVAQMTLLHRYGNFMQSLAKTFVNWPNSHGVEGWQT